MNKLFTYFFMGFVFICKSQTLTYSNYSVSLSYTLPVNIADNSSYTSSLSTTTGSNVTWNASGLIQQSGTPTVYLSFHPSSSTPQGSLYPTSNLCEFDPALTSVLDYNYNGINSDSIIDLGAYSPNGAHEIYQNPDKRLIFPFAFGQSFNDTYAKTNYSNATTISSNQTGNRTVTFAGYGTLMLPQGSISNIALISEVRTNSLGPDSYYYTWMSLTDGKRWMYRKENNGSISTVWCTDATTSVNEINQSTIVKLYPNPVTNSSVLEINSIQPNQNKKVTLYNLSGQEVRSFESNQDKITIEKENLSNGLYYYKIYQNDKFLCSGKFSVQ
jgi:hypothetical protein